MKTTRLRLIQFSLAAALTFLGIIATPIPANAAVAYVDGAGAVTDDWGNNPEICASSSKCSNWSLYSWNNNLVVLWQTVLFSDGFLPASGIDGQFGSQTASATEAWQRWRGGLSVDGEVGFNTWSKADNYLVDTGDYEVYYNGRYGRITFQRYGSSYQPPNIYTMQAAVNCNRAQQVVFDDPSGGSGNEFLYYHNHQKLTDYVRPYC